MIAALRADELLQAGDMEDVAEWKRMLRAVEEPLDQGAGPPWIDAHRLEPSSWRSPPPAFPC